MRFNAYGAAALAALGVAGAAPAARGAVTFNEILFDAPGANTGKRFIEVVGSTGGPESLADLTVLQIDGDGGARGLVDGVMSFGDVSTGSNGLALLRDGDVVLSPAPAEGTTVVPTTFQANENTTISFLLVRGFTGGVGSDIDADNDGVVDSTLPFTEAIDAVGFRDASTDSVYGAAFGGVDFEEADAPFSGTDAGGFLRDELRRAHVFRAAQESDTGPFTVALSATLPEGFALTPGDVNPRVVPEPAALGLLGLAGVGLLRRRRNPRA